MDGNEFSNNDIFKYAKRLADYVRMEIENESIVEDSPLHIAYRDFMIEWEKYQNLIKQFNKHRTLFR